MISPLKKEQKEFNLERQQLLIHQQLSNRPVRSMNGAPRTPQERPLVLPGYVYLYFIYFI